MGSMGWMRCTVMEEVERLPPALDLRLDARRVRDVHLCGRTECIPADLSRRRLSVVVCPRADHLPRGHDESRHRPALRHVCGDVCDCASGCLLARLLRADNRRTKLLRRRHIGSGPAAAGISLHRRTPGICWLRRRALLIELDPLATYSLLLG